MPLISKKQAIHDFYVPLELDAMTLTLPDSTWPCGPAILEDDHALWHCLRIPIGAVRGRMQKRSQRSWLYFSYFWSLGASGTPKIMIQLFLSRRDVESSKCHTTIQTDKLKIKIPTDLPQGLSHRKFLQRYSAEI